MWNPFIRVQHHSISNSEFFIFFNFFSQWLYYSSHFKPREQCTIAQTMVGRTLRRKDRCTSTRQILRHFTWQTWCARHTGDTGDRGWSPKAVACTSTHNLWKKIKMQNIIYKIFLGYQQCHVVKNNWHFKDHLSLHHSFWCDCGFRILRPQALRLMYGTQEIHYKYRHRLHTL